VVEIPLKGEKMTQAEQILAENATVAEIDAAVKRLDAALVQGEVEIDQHWGRETTTYTFPDGSQIVCCGGEASLKGESK
jgi:hypothetical protein